MILAFGEAVATWFGPATEMPLLDVPGSELVAIGLVGKTLAGGAVVAIELVAAGGVL
jgi:hypothetical protein